MTQDAVATAHPGTRNHTRLIVAAIALTLFTLPLSLFAWVPLYVMARREGDWRLAWWSMFMVVAMALALVVVGMHVIFGTHLSTHVS